MAMERPEHSRGEDQKAKGRGKRLVKPLPGFLILSLLKSSIYFLFSCKYSAPNTYSMHACMQIKQLSLPRLSLVTSALFLKYGWLLDHLNTAVS